jgi:AraC-like DNA-binding protein
MSRRRDEPTKRSDEPVLATLWLDLTRSTDHSELPQALRDACALTHLTDFHSAQERLASSHFDWVILDFDFPNSALLREAKAFKSKNMSTPMVVSTVQHSEAMAVWAFRSKFFDFLVKPIPAHEIRRCIRQIQDVRAAKSNHARKPIQHIDQLVPEEAAPSEPYGESILRRAITYVEKNFHTHVRNEEIAELCHMNAFAFSRQFKKVFGIGFHEFLTRYRLREARRLLENPAANVTHIALTVGFNDPSYFSRVFKKYFGANPSSFAGKPSPTFHSNAVDANYEPLPVGKRKRN